MIEITMTKNELINEIWAMVNKFTDMSKSRPFMRGFERLKLTAENMESSAPEDLIIRLYDIYCANPTHRWSVTQDIATLLINALGLKEPPHKTGCLFGISDAYEREPFMAVMQEVEHKVSELRQEQPREQLSH